MASQLRLSLIAAPSAVHLETRDVEGYEFTFGRGHDVDWSLLDPDRNILSRRHCVLVQEDGDWWVEDLSGNGTYLNAAATPIGPGARQRLRDGDRVRLGPYEFQVSLTAEPAPSLVAPAPFGTEPGDPWTPSSSTATGGAPPFDDTEDRASGPSSPMSPFPMAAPHHQGGGANPFLDSVSGEAAWDDPAHDVWPPPEAPKADAWPPSAPPASAPPPFAPPPFAPPPLAPAVEPAPRVASVPPLVVHSPFGSPAATPETEAAGGQNPFAEPADGASSDHGDPPAPIVPEPAPVAAEPPPVAVAPPPVTAPPPPVVADPPRSVPPAPAEARPLAPDRLLPALLEGAGLPDANPRDPEQTMRALGEAFRAMVKGVRDAQRARRTVRGEFRIAQTSFTQNPLKTAVSDDDALEALLGAGRRNAMSAPRAVEEVLREIVQHELATFSAMQDALRVLVDSFAPDKLRAQADQGGGLAVLPAQRKARAWDLFEAEHARVSEALRDDFDSVFGKAFARAYERVVSEQGP